MNFAQYYFTEIVSTPRVGIKHLYGGDDGKYSMSPKDFLEIINYIKNFNKGHLNAANAYLTEKADGFNLKFGLDENDKFFIESSHSGPVYDEGHFFRYFDINKKGVPNPISEGYEDILRQLKNNQKIIDYLKSIKTPSGIKIQAEVFYLPFAKTSETDDSIVRFIATWYKKDKLGAWATFVIINAFDGEGKPLPRDKVQKIKEDLKNLSTKELKFDYGDILDFDVDLSPEIEKVENFINNVEKEYGQKIDDIIKNPSRQKNVLEQKRKIKQEILNFQKDFSRKLSGLIKTGKFGDEYEGLVFELANGIIFKVVSDRFKEAKKAYDKEHKK